MFNRKSPSASASPGQSVQPASVEARPLSKMPSIVSGDITYRGEIVGAGDLQVEGKVFGRVDVGHLVIAEHGMLEGDVVARAVGISGTLHGSIRAKTITLSPTAKVDGDLVYDVLSIEAGAQLIGTCKRLSDEDSGPLLSAPAREDVAA